MKTFVTIYTLFSVEHELRCLARCAICSFGEIALNLDCDLYQQSPEKTKKHYKSIINIVQIDQKRP